jgi:Cytochrome oxidase assembly protein
MLSCSLVSQPSIALRQRNILLPCLKIIASQNHPFHHRFKSYNAPVRRRPLNIQLRRWATTLGPRPVQSPEIPPRPLGYWLLSCSALVFAIVTIGGVTRLTESGLSITEWKPITGVVFPTTAGEWQEEYEKYSQSPEFKMSVSST